MHHETIEYRCGDTVMKGFYAAPDTSEGRRPAVLIAHAWFGRNQFVVDKAKSLAELGYCALALDLYGDATVADNADDARALMTPVVSDRAMLRDRLLAGLEALKAQSGVDTSQIGIIGYCFGGLCALDLARSGADIKGAVSFHGLLHPNGLDPQPVKAKVLVLHGYDDPMVPPEQLIGFAQEMSSAGVDWQLHAYGGTVHSFSIPGANNPEHGTVYSATAARRSWQAMMDFFEEIFE